MSYGKIAWQVDKEVLLAHIMLKNKERLGSCFLILLALWAFFACHSKSSSPPIAPDEPPPPVSANPKLEILVQGLFFPVFLCSPQNDLERIFIVEKFGQIRIVKNGALLPTPFLDIASLLSTSGEQGLLGLAFDPNYSTNRRFYVYYSNPAGDLVLARYQASTGNADLANPASAEILLTISHPLFENHNGGCLQFGPDDYLYLAPGDGGSGADPSNNAQNGAVLLGKMLRLDVSGASSYSIPSDNPFVGAGDPLDEIWSLGLRNPWRFSFDRLNGDLYIGDVGQGGYEEVDYASAASGGGKGLNFGWRIMEASSCFMPSSGCNQNGLTLPISEYMHLQGACSITGGVVYRGNVFSNLQGHYFFGDYCAGWVQSLRVRDGQPPEMFEWPDLAPDDNITSFGEDGAGEVYLMTSSGIVYKIVPE